MDLLFTVAKHSGWVKSVVLGTMIASVGLSGPCTV